jgi:UDP-N-acetylenolpyruvoylglucosamine reductase
LKLINIVKNKVFTKYNIELQEEVILVKWCIKIPRFVF